METHLRYEPTKISRSRIELVRGMRRPQYRLRIDPLRLFYDVVAGRVEVLAIVEKATAAAWLTRAGEKA